jgi:hypothetical protein
LPVTLLITGDLGNLTVWRLLLLVFIYVVYLVQPTIVTVLCMCIITGEMEEAEKILDKFKWGHSFLELNGSTFVVLQRPLLKLIWL